MRCRARSCRIVYTMIVYSHQILLLAWVSLLACLLAGLGCCSFYIPAELAGWSISKIGVCNTYTAVYYRHAASRPASWVLLTVWYVCVCCFVSLSWLVYWKPEHEASCRNWGYQLMSGRGCRLDACLQLSSRSIVHDPFCLPLLWQHRCKLVLGVGSALAQAVCQQL
jgi:hypothetical protein